MSTKKEIRAALIGLLRLLDDGPNPGDPFVASVCAWVDSQITARAGKSSLYIRHEDIKERFPETPLRTVTNILRGVYGSNSTAIGGKAAQKIELSILGGPEYDARNESKESR